MMIRAIALLLALPFAAFATPPTCVNLPNSVCKAGDTMTGALTIQGASPLVFDGATVDANVTTFSVVDPTAARTVKIPNANSATATNTGLPCSAGQHISDFSVTTGVFTCSTDTTTAHNLLSSTHGDTVTHTVARGDMIVGNSTPAWAAVAIGSANKVWHSNGTDPSWQSLTSSDIGPGTLAGVLTWNESCTASPCTLANAPRTSDTALVVHHELAMHKVAACGGEGEYTVSGAVITACGEAWSTGTDDARVTYER